MTFYFVDAEKFFPGEMNYTSWTLILVSGSVSRDPCSNDVTGVTFSFGGKGWGWMWGEKGVSSGHQGIIQ